MCNVRAVMRDVVRPTTTCEVFYTQHNNDDDDNLTINSSNI